MKAVFRRRGATLIPVDEEGQLLLSRLKADKDVIVEVKQARSTRQHRLLFAVLKFLVDHVEHFQNTEQALTGLKIACGLVDTFVDPDSGKSFFTPRSISFSSMDQTAFAAFFDRAIYVVTHRWLPTGTTEESVRAEIEAMVSPNRESAA